MMRKRAGYCQERRIFSPPWSASLVVRMIPFAEYCARIQEHVEQAYHVNVVTRDIPAPLLGDLDGLEIHIDPAVDAAQRLFLLAHLFGHTVQWNVNAGAFEIGKLFQPPVEESLL